MGVVVVAHSTGDVGRELGFQEEVNHLGYVVFDAIELLLHIVAFLMSIFDEPLNLELLLVQLLDLCDLLLLAHLGHVLVHFDFQVDVPVVVFKGIRLLIQHVHIVIQTVVLLFSFDESRYYFIDIGDAACLLYLIESLFNDLSVLRVLVNQVFLLFVYHSNFLYSGPQDGYWVSEFGLLAWGCFGVIDVLVETLVVELDRVVSVLEPLLQLLNLELEDLLLFFVLSF